MLFVFNIKVKEVVWYEDIKWCIQGMLFSIVVSIDHISECYEGL